MRTHRFRPAFDHLDRRISLSDATPTPQCEVKSSRMNGPDYSNMISNDPDMYGGKENTMVYCSGDGSDYDPTNPGK